MKKTLVVIGILAVAMVALTAGESEAWGRGRVFIGVGPFWGWGYPGPYYGYAYGYPYGGYAYGYPYGYPSTVVVQQPQVYVEQAPPAPATEPPAASAESPAQAPPDGAYWYYCPGARDYYPSAPTCPEPWLRVPARTQ